MKAPRDFTIPTNLSRHMVEISKNTTLEIYADVTTLAWLQNSLEELRVLRKENANLVQSNLDMEKHLLDMEEEYHDLKKRQTSMQRYMEENEYGDEDHDEIWYIKHADMLVWSGQRDLPTEPVTTETELPEQHPWAVKE